MNLIQALILGIIQGLTEFLPVSSSTHLTLAKRIMGIEDASWFIYFDLVCHLGTLMAVVVVFFKDVLKVLSSFRLMARFSLAILPLFPAYFLFRPVRDLIGPQEAGFLLFIPAVFMFFASRTQLATVPTANLTLYERPWSQALLIGAAQACALCPGISRSAITLSTAKILGWSWNDCVRFSFLLSIPTILGGSVWETLQMHQNLSTIPWDLCMMGFSAALITGIGSMSLLFWILNRESSLKPFAWYCFGLWLVVLLIRYANG